VLWYELLTTDVAAAKEFYATVGGWTVEPFAAAAQPYEMWKRGDGVPVGGVMTIPDGMIFPPHWGMYVGVPALEAAVAQVEQLGGSALSPVIEVPTVGRMRTIGRRLDRQLRGSAGGPLLAALQEVARRRKPG